MQRKIALKFLGNLVNYRARPITGSYHGVFDIYFSADPDPFETLITTLLNTFMDGFSYQEDDNYIDWRSVRPVRVYIDENGYGAEMGSYILWRRTGGDPVFVDMNTDEMLKDLSILGNCGIFIQNNIIKLIPHDANTTKTYDGKLIWDGYYDKNITLETTLYGRWVCSSNEADDIVEPYYTDKNIEKIRYYDGYGHNSNLNIGDPIVLDGSIVRICKLERDLAYIEEETQPIKIRAYRFISGD